MYELKEMESYLRVNLLGPGPPFMKKEFTGPRSHKCWETLRYTILLAGTVNRVQVIKQWLTIFGNSANLIASILFN